MSPLIILENRTKRPPRMLILNLDVRVASVRVENRTSIEGKDGKRRVKISTKSVPDSLHIPAGESSLPLPRKYLMCSEIQAAITSHEIRVRDYEEPKSTPVSVNKAEKGDV